MPNTLSPLAWRASFIICNTAFFKLGELLGILYLSGTIWLGTNFFWLWSTSVCSHICSVRILGAYWVISVASPWHKAR